MNKQENLIVNTLRVLSAEGIEKANSGHPGLALGSAPIVYKLYADFMVHNPKNPNFINRDRFILSAGHGSMLLYSVLHVMGYDVTMDDLKNFRQLGSRTPGHPEYGVTKGIETSTGPLGQGVANGVGFALAESFLAEKFNRPNFNIINHFTYVLTGDGCMQEGIEYEAASFAGTNKLGKLIVLYDKNDITIEGDISTSFTEDVGKRHEAQGWHVQIVEDANDISSLGAALTIAKSTTQKPSLIIVKSQIGYGSSKQGSESSHGAPLGKESLESLRKNLNYTTPPFEVEKEVSDFRLKQIKKGKAVEAEWNELYSRYKAEFPDLAEEFESYLKNEAPNLDDCDALFDFDKGEATRQSSYTVLNKLTKVIPNLIGGTADLGPSTKAVLKNEEYYSATNRTGLNIHFGIREHAMSAICNGMYLHGGLRPFCSTFFVFSDYMKNGMRLSSLMNIPVIYVLSHDSIGVGEDGPTHQPIEQLIGLRTIPNMHVFRPADAKETAAAWISAIEEKSPTAIVLSRQNLPLYENTGKDALKGGYILKDSESDVPQLILIATGSEMEPTMKAYETLKNEGIDVRVVSMPCIELFESQPEKYKQSVLPKKVRARIAIEAGSKDCWYKYVGIDGDVIGMDSFGISSPPEKLFEKFGFTAENIVEKAYKVLKKKRV